MVVDWWSLAACCDADTALFFGQTGHQARTICQSCSVRLDCREYAIADPDIRGIWGGTSDEDRNAIRKGRTRAASALNVTGRTQVEHFEATVAEATPAAQAALRRQLDECEEVRRNVTAAPTR